MPMDIRPEAHQEIWNVSCMTCYHVPFFQHASVWKWTTNLKRKQNISAKVCLSTFMFQRAYGICTEYWPTFSFWFLMYVCVRQSIQNRTQFLRLCSDKISACSCFKPLPFPKCCTDCPTMAEKGYTGLSFADDQLVSGSHVHGKFS